MSDQGKHSLLDASFRDPSGFLFRVGDTLYRQVNHSYQENYTRLMESGLYQNLVKAGLLIPHHEVNLTPPRPDLAFKVIQPEPVKFISYPYEWCFSQLKQAALVTLEIQKRALQSGMSLKDSSAYNIQFHQGRALLIDSLSFEDYQEGKPWVAYRQFCQHFLAPLSLMAHRDVRLSQLLRVYIDGIPLDLASKLLPRKTRFNFSLQVHIHLHAASQKRYAAQSLPTDRRVNRTGMLGLIDSLETGVRNLQWTTSGTEWGDYYEETNYTPAGLQDKQRTVAAFLQRIHPGNVWDLGANTGLFSRQASNQGIPTLAFDIDPLAVERNFLEIVRQKEKEILPLLMDLTNPSPSLGWDNQERMSLLERAPAEAVLALALIHHLAISNNVPLDRLAAFFRKMGHWLVVEFVPKSDSQVQRLLATREDIFPNYTSQGFEMAFSKEFILHQVVPIQDSERCLYLMEAIDR